MYYGVQYPIINTPQGLLSQKRGVDQIKADLLQLLLTNPGERVMLPQFGTPLRELLFDPNDTSLELEAERVIASAIQKWEPRIDIRNISVTSQVDSNDLNPSDNREESGAVLGIKIEFVDPDNIAEIEALYFELPFGG